MSDRHRRPTTSCATSLSEINGLFDSPKVQAELCWLTLARSKFRLSRTMERIRSPRRFLATLSAAAFLIMYVLFGVLILSNRQPADPQRLQAWLSGGMVLYAIYHAVRCLWSEAVEDLEITPAARLWLGGAPIQRSSLTLYRVSNQFVATAAKTCLLCVMIYRDVAKIEFLLIGVFCSLLLLDIVRQIFERLASGLSAKQKRFARGASVLVVTALGFQVIARVAMMTPSSSPTWLYVLNSFYAVGQIAESVTLSLLSLAFMPAATIAVSAEYSLWTLAVLVLAIASLPIAILALVAADGWSIKQQQREESRQLKSLSNRCGSSVKAVFAIDADITLGAILSWIPTRFADVIPILARQYSGVVRYRGTILFSFLVPTLLCLSPLLHHRVIEQWFYVVGGIALCTILLAPPALRIDFRRDLARMQLLKSLPVKPLSMVLGQLSLPIIITWTFQLVTLSVAAIVVRPSFEQWFLWGMMLAALAVFTFATENALFLAYPHHAHQQGFAMMLRAKLTFLAKGTLIGGALTLLVLWAGVCSRLLPEAIERTVFVSGAIASTWAVALAGVAITIWCWQRFDLSLDVPPQ